MVRRCRRSGLRCEVPAFTADDQQPPVASDTALEVIYTIQPGDTLWALGAGSTTIQSTGRSGSSRSTRVGSKPTVETFNRRGLIYPAGRDASGSNAGRRSNGGWAWWYTVQHGDTLSDISARLLGDPRRSDEVFQLNQGARSPDGRVLLDPNIIWPQLRLRLPLNGSALFR